MSDLSCCLVEFFDGLTHWLDHMMYSLSSVSRLLIHQCEPMQHLCLLRHSPYKTLKLTGKTQMHWCKNRWTYLRWVLTMWYPCDVHMIPMWCACDTHVVYMWYPLRHSPYRTLKLTGKMQVHWCKHRFTYYRWVLTVWYPCAVHVTPMCCACDTHVLCLWYPCVVHVTPMCCACDTHVLCMWHLCGVHVISMWCACDTHVMYMWYPLRHSLYRTLKLTGKMQMHWCRNRLTYWNWVFTC